MLNKIMAKESRLTVPRGEGKGEEWMGTWGVFLDASCYIWNRWAVGPYCTA